MESMKDKYGIEIKPGDILYNEYDRDGYHTVLIDEYGNLYLGDYESPLKNYAPQDFWEITENEN